MTSPYPPSNFGFLAEHDALFGELATAAEHAFVSDPNTTLIKLRQLGEALAQHMAALSGVEFDNQTSQADLLYRLNRELRLESQVKELFHTLRIEGNKTTHQFRTRHKEAMDGLKLARELAIWFHRSFGKIGTTFKTDPFVPPAAPRSWAKKERADYVLFVGLTPIAVVEAKKEDVNLAFKSEHYSRGFQMTPPLMDFDALGERRFPTFKPMDSSATRLSCRCLRLWRRR